MFKYSFRIRLCPFYHVTGLLFLTSHFNWVSTGLRFGTTLRTIIRMTFSGLFSYMLLKCVIPERIVIGSGVCAHMLPSTRDHCSLFFLTALELKRCGIFLPYSLPCWVFNLTLISRLSFSLLDHLLVLKFLELCAFLLHPFSTVFGVSATKLPLLFQLCSEL